MKAIFEGKILTVPNLLSFLRLCMVPLFLWIYLGLDEPLWAAGLLVLSGITDTVDGWIARKFHQVSNLGKALDPFADKVTQIAVVTCLSIRFPRLWIVSGVLLAKESFALVTSLMAIHSSGEVQGADCLVILAAHDCYRRRSLEELNPEQLRQRVEQMQDTLKKVSEAKDKAVGFAQEVKKFMESFSGFMEKIREFMGKFSG